MLIDATTYFHIPFHSSGEPLLTPGEIAGIVVGGVKKTQSLNHMFFVGDLIFFHFLFVLTGEPLLTPGEIAGIVIGGVVFIVIVIVLIYFCTCNVRRYRQKKMKIADEKSEQNGL